MAHPRRHPATLAVLLASLLAFSVLLCVPSLSARVGCGLRAAVLVARRSDDGAGLRGTAGACIDAQATWQPRKAAAGQLAAGAVNAIRRATAKAASAVAEAAALADAAADAAADSLQAAADDAQAEAELGGGGRLADEGGALVLGGGAPGDGLTVGPEYPAATSCEHCAECLLPDGTWFSAGSRYWQANKLVNYTATSTDDAKDDKRLPPEVLDAAVAATGRNRNCSRCTGCTSRLLNLDLTVRFDGSDYSMPYTGASPSWTLLTNSDRTANGRAVAKLLCAPIDRQGKPGKKCDGKTLRKARTLSALDALASSCGLRGSVVSPFWMERIRAPLPGSGAVFDGLAFMTDLAEGLPGNIMSKRFQAKGNVTGLNAILGRVPPASIIGAATFDYLVGQCDRHPDNAFFTPKGKMTLIDNDQALGDAWRACSHDSIFLPGTEKFDINAFGYVHVTKKAATADAVGPDALVALDPRCAVSDQRIPGAPLDDLGTIEERARAARKTSVSVGEMPERLAHCVRELAADDGATIAAERLGFTLGQSREISARARAVLAYGLIGAIERGPYQNPGLLSRKVQPPCCAVWQHGRRTYCLHEWTPDVPSKSQLWKLVPESEVKEVVMEAAPGAPTLLGR